MAAAASDKNPSRIARFGQRAALSGMLFLGGAPGQASEEPETQGVSIVAGSAAEDEGGDEAFDEADASARLKERTQRARAAEGRQKAQEDMAKQAGEPPPEVATVWSLFIGWVSKAALASIIGAFLWFPFLLVVGDFVFRGKHPYIPGVTWDLLLMKMGATPKEQAKLNLLPDILAKAIVLFMLLVDILVVCLLAVLMVIQVYLEYKAIMVIVRIFGPLTNNLLDLLNLPHVPLP
ncbi:hypothetical protein EPO34_02395 [Patescibacteria group bacterium]|nr:MAG: hypothetical protein EPO34_02395 [Patescibacteria group bacterium]